MKSTDEFMVSQVTKKFDSLKACTKGEIEKLKEEMAKVMKHGMMGPPSELLAKVNSTLGAFKKKASTGQMVRTYEEVLETLEVCAGCCGLIHGKNY